MLRLVPIIAHETESGFVWWDEALMFAVPIVVAILIVVWIARRGSGRREDEERT